MSENRPRPRAFRLDDAKVAVDDAPAPLLPKATVRSQSALIPEAPAPGLDAGERDIEALVVEALPEKTEAGGVRRGGGRRPGLHGEWPQTVGNDRRPVGIEPPVGIAARQKR